MKSSIPILILILLFSSSLNAMIKINKVLNEIKNRNKILRKLDDDDDIKIYLAKREIG